MASLARWNDRWGNSKGWWLVREVPGMCIHRSRPVSGWEVRAVEEDDRQLDWYLSLLTDAERVWGKNADLQKAERLLASTDHIKPVFATRGAALHWIEGLIEIPARSALSEML